MLLILQEGSLKTGKSIYRQINSKSPGLANTTEAEQTQLHLDQSTVRSLTLPNKTRADPKHVRGNQGKTSHW
jgi:hypothetical protein